MSELSEIIKRLISLRQENDWWDFKREWYKDDSTMLHDIICMANNLSDTESYLIIGVDEENDYKCHDISNDPNRIKTHDLVTKLRDKNFAGGYRPVVYIESVTIVDGVIDVIVIERSDKTPYYLTKDFKGIKANHIYTGMI
jgi:hypothetical protein